MPALITTGIPRAQHDDGGLPAYCHTSALDAKHTRRVQKAGVGNCRRDCMYCIALVLGCKAGVRSNVVPVEGHAVLLATQVNFTRLLPLSLNMCLVFL